MKNAQLFYLIFKQIHLDRFLLAFGVFYIICCTIIWMTDSSITSFWDALWFGFMIVTTIGFGDYTVINPISRLTAAFLGIYGIVLVGFVCGVGASYLFEKIKAGKQESYGQLLWQLEHVDQLSEDQIHALQNRVALEKQKADQLKNTADQKPAGKA